MAKHSEMLEAGEKLVEYMDICHNSLVALTPLAVQRLMDVYTRHLVLMAPVGLFVPKHHLMLHLTHRALFFFGNPSWYATWRDEGHKRFFEACFHEAWKRA